MVQGQFPSLPPVTTSTILPKVTDYPSNIGAYFSCFYTFMCVLSGFSRVQLFVTLWTLAHQAPLSKGFSRQDYWSGFPCPPPRDLPDPGIESMSLASPVLAGRFFTTITTWEAQTLYK